MEALKGYIGLSSKVGEATDSGLYVDTLPDISVYIADRIASEDASSFIETWEQIEDRGLKKFRTFFIAEVNRCYRLSKVDVCECLIEENKELLGVCLWYLLGAEFMYERTSSSRLNRFTTFDRDKGERLQDDFMTIFDKELSTAVRGLDIENSECVETEGKLEHRNIITTHYAVI
jgi:hypothetical protein